MHRSQILLRPNKVHPTQPLIEEECSCAIHTGSVGPKECFGRVSLNRCHWKNGRFLTIVLPTFQLGNASSAGSPIEIQTYPHLSIGSLRGRCGERRTFSAHFIDLASCVPDKHDQHGLPRVGVGGNALRSATTINARGHLRTPRTQRPGVIGRLAARAHGMRRGFSQAF